MIEPILRFSPQLYCRAYRTISPQIRKNVNQTLELAMLLRYPLVLLADAGIFCFLCGELDDGSLSVAVRFLRKRSMTL